MLNTVQEVIDGQLIASDVMSRRERERVEMRQRITDAARHLFVNEGYERTTIRRIAEAVEYTPGAIYSYFPDKDAILFALHLEGFAELHRRFAGAIAAGGTPLDQLRRVGEAYLGFAHDHPELYDLMFVAQATKRVVSEGEPPAEATKVYGALRDLVRGAIADGWVRPADPEVVSFLLWSTCHGMVTLEFRGRCDVLPAADRDAIPGKVFDFVLASLVAADPPPRARAAAPSTRARRSRSEP
jgi:AcrR family transcriptional regulator